jgi:phage-related minor tail protein
MTNQQAIGLDLIVNGEDTATAALKRMSAAQEVLSQKIKVGVDAGAKNSRSLDQVTVATKKAENEIKRHAVAMSQGVITGNQYQREINRISARLKAMGLEEAQKKVMSFGRRVADANRELQSSTAIIKQVEAANKRLSASTDRVSTSKVRVAAAAKTATDATSRTRQAFLNTANSIAILDGPLGGVASRFSAFGVLIGRTGILLGTFAVGLSALGVATTKSIRAFMEFEVQTAKIEAVLKTTGSQSGLTASEIESMSARIALSTLESESSVRSAASQLLTFRNVSKNAFEEVLKSAADMAALGFGTVESEAVKLAKALEDPRQSLASLSRSGITFTRQQRQVIIAMVESGRQGEAMAKILENVNRQVGGAGEAAARDTMAGAFDTISQAVGRATREFGEFIVESTRLGMVVGLIAESLSDYAGGPKSVESQIKTARAEVERFNALIQEIESRSGFGQAGRDSRVAAIRAYRQEQLDIISSLEKQLKLEESMNAATRARTQLSQASLSVDNLLAEADAIRENIGLTEQQIRVNRALAAEGFFRVDISARLSAYEAALRAANTPLGEMNDLIAAFNKKLLEGIAAGDELAEALELTEKARSDREWLLRNQQNQLDAALEYFDAFVAGQQDAMNNTNFLNANLGQMAKVVGRTADEAVRLRDALAAAGRASLGRTDQISVLQAQISAARRGVSVEGAGAAAETAIQLSRAGATADQIAAAASKASSEAATISSLQDTLSELTKSASKDGRSGSKKEPTSMEGEVAALLEEQRQMKILFGLRDQEQRQMEIYFDLVKRNEKADIKMTDTALKGAAERIAIEQEKNRVIEEGLKRQQDISNMLESSMEKAFMSIVDGTSSVKDAFRAMASDIIKELYRIFVVKKITGMIAGAIPGLGGGVTVPNSVLAAISPNANGNAFSNGNVVPFANGGVVGSPTTFPMAGGKTGLMGEAGPEAIMPLKRGKDGKLGVAADGGGAVVVNNHFNISANGDDSVKRIVRQQIPQIAEATKAAVVDAKRRGGSYGRAFG